MALPLLAMPIGAGSSQEGRVMTETSDADEAPLLEALQRVRTTSRLDGVEVEYWVGGGLPPPDYRSDQFRLVPGNGQDVVEFARPLRSSEFPDGLIEKFRRYAQPSEVSALAGLILDLGVFSWRFTEEMAPAHDQLSTEILVGQHGRTIKRAYAGRLPDELDRIRAWVAAATRDVIAAGAHGLFDKGRLVRVERVGPALLRP